MEARRFKRAAPNDDVMHLCRFREADGPPHQALDAGSQRQMLALDFLCVALGCLKTPFFG